jgi:hypothetical protein
VGGCLLFIFSLLLLLLLLLLVVQEGKVVDPPIKFSRSHTEKNEKK